MNIAYKNLKITILLSLLAVFVGLIGIFDFQQTLHNVDLAIGERLEEVDGFLFLNYALVCLGGLIVSSLGAFWSLMGASVIASAYFLCKLVCPPDMVDFWDIAVPDIFFLYILGLGFGAFLRNKDRLLGTNQPWRVIFENETAK